MSSTVTSDLIANETMTSSEITTSTDEENASTSDIDQTYRSSTQYSFTPSAENSKTSTKPEKSAKKDEEEDDDKRDDSMFVCNICLDIAKDSVITFCGHLYCWPCINCWLETKRPGPQLCPVCKAAISKDKVIPLYGRNSDSQQDPRSKKIPPRPQGMRTEPDNNNQGFQGFQNGFGDGGFHLSFGIGAFPFGFFASSFNFNDIRPRNGQQPGSPQYEEDQFLSKVFLWVAMIFFCWLILA